MNPSPLAILLIIAIGAAVFGGIVFFGLRGPVSLPTGGPITTGTTMRVPDILNLPGFGNQSRQFSGQSAGGGSNAPISPETSGPDVVVEKSELPSPVLPGAPALSQQLKFSTPIQIAPSRQTQPRSFSVPPPAQIPQPPPVPQPAPLPVPRPQTAAASFSVFTSSPQLRALRTQMVQEGVIADSEFIRINNNADMETFMLKLVEWQARKAGSADAQIQDALDRIRKAYDQIRTAGSGR